MLPEHIRFECDDRIFHGMGALNCNFEIWYGFMCSFDVMSYTENHLLTQNLWFYYREVSSFSLLAIYWTCTKIASRLSRLALSLLLFLCVAGICEWDVTKCLFSKRQTKCVFMCTLFFFYYGKREAYYSSLYWICVDINVQIRKHKYLHLNGTRNTRKRK